jgi:hypothetical protein
MTGLFLGEAAVPVPVRDLQPFSVPALGVARDDARRGLEDFADSAPALLSLPEPAPELVGEPRMLRPMVPAVRLIVGPAIGRDPLDRVIGQIGCHATQSPFVGQIGTSGVAESKEMYTILVE